MPSQDSLGTIFVNNAQIELENKGCSSAMLKKFIIAFSLHFVWHFAQFALPLHAAKVGYISAIKIKNIVFYFVLRSFCTTFVD